LPLLEKVIGKTICLEDYTIQEGACEALASAIPFLDPQHVNRIILSNNGVQDHSFEQILKAIAQTRDFKSIIYK